MTVIYSIAAKFAGGGIGTTSYNAVSGIFKHGYLKDLYCVGYNPTQIDSRLIHKLPTALLDRLAFVPQNTKYLVKDLLFDYLVSLKDLKTDVFHGWNGHCLQSLKKAKSQGAITFVERASSHINTYEKLVGGEYRRWGVKAPVVSEGMKKRLLEEYEIADYINTPSEFAYKSMVENGVDSKKINLLPFGVDVQKFKVQSSKCKVTGQSSKFNVLFVGQVGFRKGVPYLLQAWQKLKLEDAKLYLVGEEEEVAHDYLKQFKSDPTIEFVGYADPLPYYQEADVFVFPSIEEGSALVTYEALACGLPVITTFNSGSVVRDGKEGFIVSIRDVDELVDRIKYLYENASEREKMGALARKRAEEFTWEGYGGRLVKTYKKRLSSSLTL